MIDIISLAIIGLIAGTLAGFWTRIIREDMIFSFVGKWFVDIDRKCVMRTGKGYTHPLRKFMCCVFCTSPWFCFILDACYIAIFTPAWYLCIIGVFASLGAGNLVAEIIYALRGRE